MSTKREIAQFRSKLARRKITDSILFYLNWDYLCCETPSRLRKWIDPLTIRLATKGTIR